MKEAESDSVAGCGQRNTVEAPCNGSRRGPRFFGSAAGTTNADQEDGSGDDDCLDPGIRGHVAWGEGSAREKAPFPGPFCLGSGRGPEVRRPSSTIRWSLITNRLLKQRHQAADEQSDNPAAPCGADDGWRQHPGPLPTLISIARRTACTRAHSGHVTVWLQRVPRQVVLHERDLQAPRSASADTRALAACHTIA